MSHAVYRFHTFRQYLSEKHPFPVRKVPVDAGFTCPNRDGTRGTGGCLYCDNRSFSLNSVGTREPLTDQIEKGMSFQRNIYGDCKYILYFQAFSNTHGPVERLKSLYDTVFRYPDMIGLSIGTRPDCIDADVVGLIDSYADKLPEVWVELGLQSIHETTLSRVNRGHTFSEFLRAYKLVRQSRAKICVHVIAGFPWETREMMMRTADAMAGLNVDSVKIHHFYVAKDTGFVAEYERGELPVMTLGDYVKLTADFLERLPERTSVQRLVGEIRGDYLIAPRWDRAKRAILDLINTELIRRNSGQGAKPAEPVTRSFPSKTSL
ncbi:MAG TPA: TIGR01212 family radical SAM protein [Elusimicrobiota bacterium]|nr:TIGR01212 family radical SAM protein [Elusimicrobiota bacterium]